MIEESYVSLGMIGYKDYGVNTKGEVISFRSNKKLRSKIDKGYERVTLSKNNKRKLFPVHRLVAIAFIPNPENKPCINHKNGVKTDNMVENLEWCTYSENTLHAYATGLEKPRIGFKHTEEAKLKMSKNRKGIKHTQEWKENMRKIMKGRKFSEDTIKKMSHSAQKTTHSWKPIINLLTGKKYPSVTIARKMEGIKEHEIYKAIKNGEYKYL